MSEHPEHADENLAERFRAGLRREAGRVDTGAPLVTAARGAARRRRRARVVGGLVAATVTAVLVAVAVQATGDDDERGVDVVDQGPVEPIPTAWRTEYWHDIQVEVPAGWAWGAAPFDTGGDLIRCGGPTDEPYVGRPISQTDVCSMVKNERPTDSYVWLGADIGPGRVDLEGGMTQETVDIDGTTVTVAARSEELRRRILDSAQVSQFCPVGMDMIPEGRSESTFEGVGDLMEARVCAYSNYDDDTYRLVAASTLELKDFQAMQAAVEAAPGKQNLCKSVPEFVVVTGWYADPYSAGESLWLQHDRVFELSCGVVDLGTDLTDVGRRVRMTDAAVNAWRNELYSVSLHHFIGPLG